MPTPPPPLKRRRLHPPSTLSKPFKSPLKNPPATSPPTPTPPTPTHPPPPPTPTSPPPNSHLCEKSTSPAKPLSPTKSTPNPTLLSLRRQHTTLLSTLAAARATLDTATQALKLEAGDTDAELEALVRKWRGVSREAAEEVYRDVRERVNRMGGVRGWKARERERRKGMEEFMRGWEGEGKDEGEAGEDGEGRSGEEGEKEEEKVEEEDGDEDEGFTMDMMLKSLNIDLEIIGFDKREQRWID